MKRMLALIFLICPLWIFAQTQFGYLNYKQVMQQMPDYVQAMQELDTLKAKYEAEAIRGEEEFQKKFVDFLQGQKDFPQTIMQKRQGELQTLMDNGVAFRLQVQALLAQAERDLVGEVEKKLNRILLEIGVEYGYGFILNTDDNSCPYINPTVGVDVTQIVLQKLGLVEPPVEVPIEVPEQTPIEVKPLEPAPEE